jgi:long-chain-fatty-acid--[acyl-carrier-protein] ligase
MIVFRGIFWFLMRLIMAARYRLRVHGKEQLKNLKGPTLILPNHPGYIDPFVLFATLWPALRMRPLVYAGTFRGPTGRFLVHLVNALEVSDLEVASVQARAEAEKAIGEIAAGLRRGENYILWPAGHVQRDGSEHIGPARSAADILHQVPEANVLLVRSRGIWGSSWTYAQLGARPPLVRLMLAGVGWILANLFFFMPRRRVTITLEVVDRSRMPEPRREMLNPWLESWFNNDQPNGVEQPTWVPYHFLFGRRSFIFPQPATGVSGTAAVELALDQVKPETREGVLHLLEDRLKRPLTDQERSPSMRLDEMGLDSLDRMELSLQIERRFGFSGEEAGETLGQLLALAEGRAQRKPPTPPPAEWSRPRSKEGPLVVQGDTIPAAFVAQMLANRREVIVADDVAGALTGEQLLIRSLTVARWIRKVEAPNVGLLLPASAACDIALLGLKLAGKLPVVLNWTTGTANLAHAAQVMQLTHVVTSKVFADRTGVTVEGTEFLFLEDLKANVGKMELIRTLLKVRWLPGSIKRLLPSISPDQPAVVLFTSGSEKAPKAVPLTHANILSCQRAGIPFLGLTRQDVMLGFLPAFHSFGLTVTSLLPLLSGMSVVHHPDPTDAANLVHKIAAYGVTVLMGTPTFVNHILARAKIEDLASLRLIIVGAEQCPPSVFDRCRELAPQARVLEGYGITECAPVVAVNPPNAPRPGSIGQPLPGVDVRVVCLDSGSPLPAGQMGMMHVSGPTVFPGYLGHDAPSPFVEEEGRRWYVTGDLGERDADGYLWFRGRLKRFLKVGGEMISLPALEEPFVRLFPPTEKGPRVAVEGIEHESGRRIVLFTTESIGLREANGVLLKSGFHGVMRLDEVRRVDAIQTLGTGKTDYKLLRGLILEEVQTSVPV